MKVTRIKFPEILATELLAFHRVFYHFDTACFARSIQLHRDKIDTPFRQLGII